VNDLRRRTCVGLPHRVEDFIGQLRASYVSGTLILDQMAELVHAAVHRSSATSVKQVAAFTELPLERHPIETCDLPASSLHLHCWDVAVSIKSVAANRYIPPWMYQYYQSEDGS
jgi:hypothetical protein